MKQLLVCVIGLAMAAVSGCEGSSDATCAVCERSFTEADCARIAAAHGCSGSAVQVDELCPDHPMGCRFMGCPAGPIMCDVSPADGGL